MEKLNNLSNLVVKATILIMGMEIISRISKDRTITFLVEQQMELTRLTPRDALRQAMVFRERYVNRIIQILDE